MLSPSAGTIPVTAISTTGHHPLVVVAPEWPTDDSGYSLAIACALRLYLRHFSPVIYLGVSRRSLPPFVRDAFPEVDFRATHRPAISQGIRFLRSIVKSTPATLEDFPQSEIFTKTTEAAAHLRRTTGVLPAVIAEDVMLGWLLACKWKGRAHTGQIAIRSHNILGEIFEGFDTQGSPLMRWAWRHEICRGRTLEAQAAPAASAFWAITDRDAEKYKSLYNFQPAGVVDMGIASPPPVQPSTGTNVIYLGTADLRKGHGLKQFLTQAWPLVRAAVPDARLLLGGRGTEHFTDDSAGVTGTGFVPDQNAFYGRGSIAINPQLRGSGIKIKSIMAMFAGRALVSTVKGMEGVLARPGEDFLLAESMPEMAQTIISLLRDPARAEAIGRSARVRAETEYTLDAFYHRCDAPVRAFADLCRAAQVAS